MDSTDTTCGKPATSTSAGKGAAAGASLQPIKDSPFSTYINSFSPISPIQTRPGFLSYGSIYFTSQEPVFRSPHIHQTNQDIWRSLERHPRDDTACLRDMKTDRTLFLPSTLQPMPSLHSKFDENQSPEKQPCRSSPIVDVSLAGPSEIGLNASDSPDLCSKQTEKAYQGRCTMITANQTNSDHNGSPNSQNIAPSSSSALNEFMASSLRSSDLTYVQLNQDTILPRALLDDCSYSGGNVVNFHRSIMHKYICDNSTENVENKLKAPCQVEGSHDMSHDEQLKPAFTATGICRALPAGAQNEKSLINQKWTDVAPFESMNNQNLTHEILKTTSSFLYYRKCIGMDISENLKSGELGLNSKFIQRSLLDVHTVEKSTIPTEDLFLYDEEVSQHQHAMRKDLEFVTAENLRKSPGSKKQISNFTSNIFVADSAENLMSTDTLDTSIAELNKTSSSKQYVQSTVKISMSCQKEGASYVSVPRPFVIGLRSNTLGSVGQTTRTDMQLMERDICERDTLFLGVNDRVVQTSKNQLTSTSLTSHDSIALIASKDKVFHSGTNYDNDVVFGGRNLNKELPISSDSYEALLDQYLTPRNMKTLPAENSNSAAMSNQSSSRKKRKGANNEGQKCCSCKRSQCLKLYCDCFAAGMVCTEACECHECFNSPQHEETILEKRKQIETRNPLAFTPKVLLGASDNKESISYTPSSARHKRGCNCRKSLCLKKYCECFQAGVGCSLGCRCEGCKNKFGRKDGSIEGIEIKHEKPKEENLEMESSGNRFDEVEKKEVVKTERGLRLSPLTPSTECSRYTGVDIPAPLLRLPESPSSPIRSIGDIKFDEEESGSLFLYDQGRDYHPAATLSPRWDDFDDLFNLTPLASLSPGSTTGTFDASEAAYAEIPQRKSPQGDAPSMDGGSLQLHCSPVTPPPQLGENKIPPEPDTSNGVYTDPGNGNADVLNAIPLSNGIVKLNSPKQMCISPWNQATDTTPGLRNARQDILKFVPSFPPLTPYRNKEDGTA